MPIIRKRWTSQPPPGTPIDWSHPLTIGLASALVNGFDAATERTSGLRPVGFTQAGVTERGAMPYNGASDVAEVTLIAHHKYTSDNGDYGGHTYGFYVDGSNNSQLAIGYGVVSGGGGGGADIYGVRRDNGNDITALELDVSLPYEAVWAISGTFGASSEALTYKNGLPFAPSVARSGTNAFSKNSLRTHQKAAATSTGKEYAWAYRFTRILTPDEIYRLSTDPYQIFEPYEEFVPTEVATGTVALTGNGTTASTGTLTPSLTLATTGNQATASQGTVAADTAITVALTGNAATTAQGLVVPSLSLAITGNQATASQGLVTPAGTFSAALTGVAATTATGTPVASLEVAITGNQATASSGLVTPPGNVSAALSGVATTTAVGIIVPSLSLAVTGNGTTAATGTVTPASGNVVALTGNGAVSAIGMFTQNLTLPLTGRSVTASIGSLGVGGWQQIDDSQTPNWVQIVDSQTPNWTPI